MIYELYVPSRYESLLTTSDLQFGFKIGYSTSMCTLILKETIDYCPTNGNDVYFTMLDGTKAFDRVEYCKLIHLLSIKNIPAATIRNLLNLHLFQVTHVA